MKAAVAKVTEALGSEGRILLRPSGTEPVVRVMVEAGSDAICHQYIDEVVAVMENKDLVIE